MISLTISFIFAITDGLTTMEPKSIEFGEIEISTEQNTILLIFEALSINEFQTQLIIFFPFIFQLNDYYKIAILQYTLILC